MDAMIRSDARDAGSNTPIQSDLAQMSAKLAQLARNLSRDVETGARALPAQRMSYIAFVRRLVEDRRDRDERFGAALFSDPAWDILLDLFVAAGERKNISVSSVSVGAGVPLTTALRWITTLNDAGMLTRSHDPFDRRRVHIALTEAAIEKVRTYLDGVAKRWGVTLQGMIDPVMI